ncbi:MAG: hypothetical protein ACKOQ6_11510, partial [Bacteroidota bacterium]
NGNFIADSPEASVNTDVAVNYGKVVVPSNVLNTGFSGEQIRKASSDHHATAKALVQPGG